MTGRNLTDADVKAIVDGLEERLVQNFYRDIGKGVWGFAKKTLIALMLLLAAYGAIKSLPTPPPNVLPQ